MTTAAVMPSDDAKEAKTDEDVTCGIRAISS